VTHTTQNPFYVGPRINVGYQFAPNILFDVEYDYYNYTTLVSETGASTKNIENTLGIRFYIEL
jgi:outer membrane protease